LRRPDDLAPAWTPVAWKDSELPRHRPGIHHDAQGGPVGNRGSGLQEHQESGREQARRFPM
jgi:hypothetical protein